MNILWGILIAIGVGWFGFDTIMPKPKLTLRAQRITVVAVMFVYGFFVLAALINHLDTPSGFSLTRFLIEGVLFGAIAGAITYGLGYAIHWAITGQTMESATAPQDSKVETEAPTPTAQSSVLTEAQVNIILALTGLAGTSLMPVMLSIHTNWSPAAFFIIYAIIIAASFGTVSWKKRNFNLGLFSMIPLGWLIIIALKSHR